MTPHSLVKNCSREDGAGSPCVCECGGKRPDVLPLQEPATTPATAYVGHRGRIGALAVDELLGPAVTTLPKKFHF